MSNANSYHTMQNSLTSDIVNMPPISKYDNYVSVAFLALTANKRRHFLNVAYCHKKQHIKRVLYLHLKRHFKRI